MYQLFLFFICSTLYSDGSSYVIKEQPNIVIVGGGVSGLAAGTRLLERGFKNVKILEAEKRLGGRVVTVPFGERYVDLGAHWINGEEGNAVYDIASKNNLTYHSGDFSNMEIFDHNGELVPKGYEMFSKVLELIEDDEKLKAFNGNLDEFNVISWKKVLKEFNKDEKYLCPLSNTSSKIWCTNEGCDDLKEASPAGSAKFIDLPGDYHTSWKDGGYSSIVQILLNNHSTSTEKPIKLEGFVHFNKEVNLIDWSGPKAKLECLDGTTFDADHVIVTVSLGVLKERYSTMFKPPLPEKKVTAIKSLGIGTINKVYLHFPNQWWPESINGLIFLNDCNYTSIIKEGEFKWEREVTGFFSESSAPNVLSTWFNGAMGKDIETYTDEQVLEGTYRALKKILGKRYTIPLPNEIMRTKWWSNPHFRGSWSFRSMASEALNVTSTDLSDPLANKDNNMILLFAGEATHPDFFATVHGAMETGWREADRLVQKYT